MYMNLTNEFDKNFITHGCEQLLRFSRVGNWNDLSESVKVQIGFNMGVIALGFKLIKEEGFQVLADVSEGKISMDTFRKHIMSLVESHQIKVDKEKVARPF